MTSLKSRRPPSMFVDLTGTLSATDYDREDEQASLSNESGDGYQSGEDDYEEEVGGYSKAELNLQDLEVEIADNESPDIGEQLPQLMRRDKKDRASTKQRAEFVSSQTILQQPEIRLMKLEKEREMTRQKYSDPYQQRAEDQVSLMKRFPWLANKLKDAWADDKSPKGTGKMKTALNMGLTKDTQKHTRFQSTKPKSNGRSNNSNDDGQPKVVFSRNIPLFIYNTQQKKCIRVGGDRTSETKSNLEEIYRAFHFNPELKKITLDLDDLRFPDKERTIRLALSYISANTLHNPFVLNDDFYKYSWKKEVMIKEIVKQIERRLCRQLQQRRDRESRLKQIDDAIQQQKEEEELRDWDFVTANRLLEESKAIDQEVLTQVEKHQERKRRIRLRTKSMPMAARADVKVRQRKQGLPHISLKPD